MGLFSFLSDNRAKKNKRETPTVEGHYIKLGRRAAFVRYTCLLLVVLFAVYSFMAHKDDITVENFRYMMKFVNIKEDAEKPKGTVLRFDGSDASRGMIYKGDLAVLSESGLAIYGWDGETTLKDAVAFDYPKMLTNGDLLYCYDIGGKEIKVYNSYSRQETKIPPFDYPIHWVAASASGSFAVVSSAQGYRSAVYVYDKNYNLVYSCLFGNKYADFVDISADGKEIIVTGHYAEKADMTTFVSRYSVNSETPLTEYSFIGETPFGIYYTESGYSLITGDFIRNYAASADEPAGVISFSGKRLMSARTYGDRSLVTYSTEGLSGGTELDVYDFGGKVLYTARFETSLSDTLLCGDAVYALAPGELSLGRINGGMTEKHYIPTSFTRLIPDGERVILFAADTARYFDKNNHDYTDGGTQ
ncbi:MAG: hypothetical protein J6252_01555 [Clostridia bacterium]|nr:hypothetical protein [Clostridia bacterium]